MPCANLRVISNRVSPTRQIEGAVEGVWQGCPGATEITEAQRTKAPLASQGGKITISANPGMNRTPVYQSTTGYQRLSPRRRSQGRTRPRARKLPAAQAPDSAEKSKTLSRAESIGWRSKPNTFVEVDWAVAPVLSNGPGDECCRLAGNGLIRKAYWGG